MNIRFRRKGKSLYLYCRHRGSEIWLSTGIRIDPKEWDDKTGYFQPHCEKKCEKIFGDVMEKKRIQLQTAIYKLEMQEKPVTPENIRALLQDRKPAPMDVLELFDAYKIYKSARVKPNTMRKIGQTREKLVRFQEFSAKLLDPYSFDAKDFSRFVLYLSRYDGISDNTISTHCDVLKDFLKFVDPGKDVSFIVYREKYFNVVYLLPEELKVLQEAQNLPPYLERTRDLFLLACYTGVRYSDLHQVHQGNVWNGVLYIMQTKTQKTCYVPFSDIVIDVLTRYDGYPPMISNQKLNDYLKILFARLKLNRVIVIRTRRGGQVSSEYKKLSEIIAMHVARKTFVMTTLGQGTNVNDVITMSGHSDFRSLKPYRTDDIERIKSLNVFISDIFMRKN